MEPFITSAGISSLTKSLYTVSDSDWDQMDENTQAVLNERSLLVALTVVSDLLIAEDVEQTEILSYLADKARYNAFSRALSRLRQNADKGVLLGQGVSPGPVRSKDAAAEGLVDPRSIAWEEIPYFSKEKDLELTDADVESLLGPTIQ